MSGFTIRRFLMQNILAVAMHSPIRVVAETAAVVNTGIPLSSAAASSARPRMARWTATLGRLGQSMLMGRHAYNDAGSPSACAGHDPRPPRPLRAPGAVGGFALMTEEEMQWVRQQRMEEAEESRVVLSVRPSRSLVRGLAGALLNLGVGCLCTPLIFLSITLERLRMSGGHPMGVLSSPVYGVVWSAVFLLTAVYAALQQSLLSLYYTAVAAPMHYGFNRRIVASTSLTSAVSARLWCPLTCRFERAGATRSTHPALQWYATETQIRERAMRRCAKRHASASSSSRTANEEEGDYYAVLGVARDAAPRQIREAYNRAVLRVHPDHNSQPNAAVEFDRVTRAYRVLSHAERRRRYDVAGMDGVHELGAKKRDGVRALFGGELLQPLTGDVLCGSFLLRVIDGLDCTAEEVAVLRQRRMEVARDELVTRYLCGSCRAGEDTAGGGGLDAATMTRLRRVLGTGLAKEVLHVVGHEYARVVDHFDAGTRTAHTESREVYVCRLQERVAGVRWWCGMPWRRARLYLCRVAPHRGVLLWRRVRCLSRLRARTLKDSAALVDLVWYSAVRELEETAASAAHAALYDPELSEAQVRQRRDALRALSTLFIQLGQPYRGANSTTMSQLMDSLRAYNQQKEQQKYA